MTTTGKIIVGIVAVLVIAAGAYYWYANYYQKHAVGGTATPVTTTATGMPASGSAASSGSGTVSSSSGTSDSDAAMNQDLSSIDAQMSGLQSDNADVSNSENTQ